jgi:hypothetical protein
MKKKLSCEKNRSTTKDAGSASPALRGQTTELAMKGMKDMKNGKEKQV